MEKGKGNACMATDISLLCRTLHFNPNACYDLYFISLHISVNPETWLGRHSGIF